MAYAYALSMKFSDAPLSTRAVVERSFQSVPWIRTLIIIFSSRSYRAVRTRYGGSSSDSTTGISLGWWLSALIPKGCRFPTVRVLLLPFLPLVLRRWLLRLDMGVCRCFSWVAGTPLRSVLFFRNCSILGSWEAVALMPAVAVLRTGIFLWRLGPLVQGRAGRVLSFFRRGVICVMARSGAAPWCVSHGCCIVCCRFR